MKNIFSVMVFFFWIPIQSQGSSNKHRTPTIDSITILMDEYIAKNNIPALTVAVIQDGKTAYITRGNTRRKDGFPISEKSVFQIASISKTFTAIIANNLINEKMLGLKVPISKYLEEDLPSTKLAKLNHITIEDLLHHRAGFPHDGESLPPSPNGAPQKKPYTKELLLKDLTNMQLDPQAEMRFSYSNFGYALLGHIMERASNKTYETLLQDYVIQPYGLKSTTIAESDVQKKFLAIPYAPHKRELELRPWITGKTKASGGIFSSTEDLVLLMNEQLKAFKKYKYSESLSPLLLTLKKVKVSGALYYGFGMFESIKGRGDQNILTLGHGGDLDGYGSFYDFYPEINMGLITLTSSGGKEFVDFHDRLERFLLSLPEKKEMFLPKQTLKRYEGTFAFGSGQQIRIKRKGDKLMTSGKGIPSLQLHALNETTFFYKEFDGWYEFEINPNDEIVGVNYIQYGEVIELQKVK